MKNVICIIEAHGGLETLKRDAIRVDPPSAGLLRLCIEYIGEGPRGHAAISVAHDYEQNGDLMQDPDVVVEVPDSQAWSDESTWGPVSFTQASKGYHGEACFRDNTGQIRLRPGLVDNIRSFLKRWNRNIGEQGYVDAFLEKKERGTRITLEDFDCLQA